MAVIQEIKDEFLTKESQAWIAERPARIRDMITRNPPYILYRYKPTNHRCFIIGYCEDGKVRIAITGEYNAIAFGRTVFGVDPGDLEECDFPAPDEPLGDLSEEIGLTAEEIIAFAKSKIEEGKKGET